MVYMLLLWEDLTVQMLHFILLQKSCCSIVFVCLFQCQLLATVHMLLRLTMILYHAAL